MRGQVQWFALLLLTTWLGVGGLVHAAPLPISPSETAPGSGVFFSLEEEFDSGPFSPSQDALAARDGLLGFTNNKTGKLNLAGVENFSTFAPDPIGIPELPSKLKFGGIGEVATLNSATPNIPPSEDTHDGVTTRTFDSPVVNGFQGRFDTSSPNDADAPFYRAAYSFSINFDNPFSAFGFYGTDFGDHRGTIGLKLTAANASTSDISFIIDPVATVNGLLIFFGFVDTNANAAYQSVTLTINQQANLPVQNFDQLGFDDLFFGQWQRTASPPQGAPEPATLAIVVLGLVLASAAQRSRVQRTDPRAN